MGDISIWFDFLKEVGLPIAIAVYLLLRFEKKICHLSDTIEELQEIIEKE